MSKRKTLIVTGGGSGIGAAISERFIAADYNVVIAQRSKPDLEDTFWIKTDVTSDSQCESLMAAVHRRFGGLDVLVNNAGIMQEFKLESTPLKDWDQTMAVNLRAPFVLTRLALPLLRAARGSIVNVGSIEGIACNPEHGAYSVSKAGLHALTRATAVDHGDSVRCNCVAPGWIETKLNEQYVNSMSDPAHFRSRIGDIHPVGRTGQASEVANLVYFLCSEDAAFICGQTFTIDGGRTIQLPLPQSQ